MATDPALGVGSVVYADRDLEGLLAELESVGIDHLELWEGHLGPDDGEEAVVAAEQALADAGVSVVGYGVVDLGDTGDVEPYAALADRLGADYITVNYPPDRDDVTEDILGTALRRGLDVAIHNYSDVHHDDLDGVFSSVDDVADVLARYDHERLGACVDTGHFLAMDEDPARAIERLGGRIVTVHLKDRSDDDTEDLPGTAGGELDLDAVVGALAATDGLDVPLIVEFELDPANATAALAAGRDNVREALDDAR